MGGKVSGIDLNVSARGISGRAQLSPGDIHLPNGLSITNGTLDVVTAITDSAEVSLSFGAGAGEFSAATNVRVLLHASGGSSAACPDEKVARQLAMTDEAGQYIAVGKEFAGHSSVNHSADEYVRLGGFVHANTAENYFSILKRGITGTYHHVSQQHLKRYLGEFDFRYNERGVDDAERAIAAHKGIEGKRLTYRRTA